jgi:hypothetical protein
MIAPRVGGLKGFFVGLSGRFFSKKNMGTKQSIDSWDPRFAEKWDFIIDFMV